MKVFISADLDGTSSTMEFKEVTPKGRDYDYHAKVMTEEVVAACEGAIAAGATEIVIKDAHHMANNIDITRLPECATLIRGWSGHPYFMVDGIDSSFDACVFIGYHCAAGLPGNPMSHTDTGVFQKALVNGEPFSELKLLSWCAAKEGVPTVFLSGDRTACEETKALYPWAKTVAVKEGNGAAVACMAPERAYKEIREQVQLALENIPKEKPVLPPYFSVELCYKEHTKATKFSYYPGVVKKDTHTLLLESDDIYEIARALSFVS